MILCDRALWHKSGTRWAHLVSDVSYEELHLFASRLGIPERAFQGDHYDIEESLIPLACSVGAVQVDPRELLGRLRAAGLRTGRDRPS